MSFALTGAGMPILCIQQPKASTRITYAFDRVTDAWTPLNLPVEPGAKRPPQLIGSDGDELVFVSSSINNSLTVIRARLWKAP